MEGRNRIKQEGIKKTVCVLVSMGCDNTHIEHANYVIKVR